MRVVALDIGEKRVGVAAGDTDTKIATPISTITLDDLLTLTPIFRRIIEEHEPKLLVVGLPLSLSGEENQQATRVRTLAEQAAAATGLPIAYQDERLSSAEARRVLREGGCTEREMRGKIDMIAASLILRAYFDATSSGRAGNPGN
jgi:putative Holliday junction resolvase